MDPFMPAAIDEAELGLAEGGIPIGSVLVHNGKIIGRHRSTGIARPRFWERAEYYGETGRLAEALAASEVSDAHGNPMGE